jgi:hypothetical protein
MELLSYKINNINNVPKENTKVFSEIISKIPEQLKYLGVTADNETIKASAQKMSKVILKKLKCSL